MKNRRGSSGPELNGNEHHEEIILLKSLYLNQDGLFDNSLKDRISRTLTFGYICFPKFITLPCLSHRSLHPSMMLSFSSFKPIKSAIIRNIVKIPHFLSLELKIRHTLSNMKKLFQI